MTNSDLLPSLLFKINENQPALEAAIMELSNWVEFTGQPTSLTTLTATWTRSSGMKNSSS